MLVEDAERILGVRIPGINVDAAVNIVTPIFLAIPLVLNVWATAMIWYKAQ